MIRHAIKSNDAWAICRMCFTAIAMITILLWFGRGGSAKEVSCPQEDDVAFVTAMQDVRDGRLHGAGTVYEATPSSNLPAMISKLQAGDTLLFTDGVYSESLDLSDLHGEEGNYITLAAAPGAHPVFHAGKLIHGGLAADDAAEIDVHIIFEPLVGVFVGCDFADRHDGVARRRPAFADAACAAGMALEKTSEHGWSNMDGMQRKHSDCSKAMCRSIVQRWRKNCPYFDYQRKGCHHGCVPFSTHRLCAFSVQRCDARAEILYGERRYRGGS